MNKKKKDKNYKASEVECLKCKAKFDIWLSTAKFTPEAEKEIREHFIQHCPACKAFERAED